MKRQLVGIIIVSSILMFAAGAFALGPSERSEGGLEIHECGNNPFTRSVGLLGGRQRQFFLRGRDTRNESPPQTDGLTRVVDVSRRDSLSDPSAEPAIDKCASWIQWSDREGLVELTVLWDDRNCSTFGTTEGSPNCKARAAFGFSLDELGIREVPDTKQERKSLEARLEREFVADVYFSRQIRPRARRSDTGLQTPASAEVHLVARVIPIEAAKPRSTKGTTSSSESR